MTILFCMLAHRQIRYQLTHKVRCQPGDWRQSLQSSSGVCVGMYGLTYSIYQPQGSETNLCRRYCLTFWWVSCHTFFSILLPTPFTVTEAVLLYYCPSCWIIARGSGGNLGSYREIQPESIRILLLVICQLSCTNPQLQLHVNVPCM